MRFSLGLLAGSLIYSAFKIEKNGKLTQDTAIYLVSMAVICLIIYILGD